MPCGSQCAGSHRAEPTLRGPVVSPRGWGRMGNHHEGDVEVPMLQGWQLQG